MTRPIKVALSGSGTRAPALVGGLCAVEDAGFTVTAMAGTSGGALVASLFCCGVSTADLKAIVYGMDWTPLMAMSPLSVLTNRGWCNGNALLKFMREKTGGRKFLDLDIDLTVMASELSNEALYVFNRALTPDVEVALAARASSAIPGVFVPVIIGDAVLADAGLVVNLPADYLPVGSPPDGIPRLGIELVGKCAPFKPGKHALNKMVPHVIDLMLQSSEDAHIQIAKMQGATIVQVESGFASSLDRKMPLELRKRLFQSGYDAVSAALKELKAA